MTTIAATRHALAGDTMVHIESIGATYPAIKVRRIKGNPCGAAGDAGDCTRMLDWAETGFAEKKRPKFTCPPGAPDEAMLLILQADGIYLMTQNDPYPEQIAADYYAIGSGGPAALGALYAGATLEQAMDIACVVDPYTRGPITVLKLVDGA
jgi:ATP-dependent protease HslVU (ClpYQ) peptidase subunit